MINIDNIFEEFKNNTYVGVVEENKDPERLGRVKIRIYKIFGKKEEIPTEDLPWAIPSYKWSGKTFSIPDINKWVSIIFPTGDPNYPIYDSALHFNPNLQKRLNALSDEEYLYFNALIMDENTQIFRDLNQGLIIDHKTSNFKIDEDGNISLNLRDGDQFIRIGSEDADNPILQTNEFLEWLDGFIQALQQTAYIGNLGAPVVLGPSLAESCAKYQTMRESFKSKHIFHVTNDAVQGLTREAIKQLGDKTKSTYETLNIQSADVSHKPKLRDESLNNNCNCPNMNPNEVNQMIKGEEERMKNFQGQKQSLENYNQSLPNNSNGLDNTLYDNNFTSVDNSINSNFTPKGTALIPNTWLCQNVDKLKTSKYLLKTLPFVKAKLQPDASDAFDAWMESYEKSDFQYKQPITFTSAHRCKGWNENDTHGQGIAVDMFWGLNTTIFYGSKYDYVLDVCFRHPVYLWMLSTGYKFGFEQPIWANNGRFNPPGGNRTSGDVEEWWHWEYYGYKKGYKIGDENNRSRVFNQLANIYKNKKFDANIDIENVRKSGQLAYFYKEKQTKSFR